MGKLCLLGVTIPGMHISLLEKFRLIFVGAKSCLLYHDMGETSKNKPKRAGVFQSVENNLKFQINGKWADAIHILQRNRATSFQLVKRQD